MPVIAVKSYFLDPVSSVFGNAIRFSAEKEKRRGLREGKAGKPGVPGLIGRERLSRGPGS